MRFRWCLYRDVVPFRDEIGGYTPQLLQDKTCDRDSSIVLDATSVSSIWRLTSAWPQRYSWSIQDHIIGNSQYILNLKLLLMWKTKVR